MVTLWWPNSRAALLALDSGGGGFVQRQELHKVYKPSGAVLEEQGHVALGSRLDPCLSEIPWPRQ